jgi:flagellar motor switch protein FliM
MLHAVLDERELTLGEIAELHIGQVPPLKATPRSNVKVVCNDQTMFWCELGQTEGVYTLRIREFPDEEQELIDAITSE